jgi:hypothetical protein
MRLRYHSANDKSPNKALQPTLGWERFGGWGLFFIALAYAGVGIWLTEFFLNRSHLPIPAGIPAAFVVVLTPLAVYGVQAALGWWAEGTVFREYHTHIDWRWMFMEFATLASGTVMLWRYRLPFLAMPIAVTIWYMSMDVTPFLFGEADATWELRKLVSLRFGLLIVLLAFWVDIRTRHDKDYAFWFYLVWCRCVLGRLVHDAFRQQAKQIHLSVHQPHDDCRGGHAFAPSLRRFRWAGCGGVPWPPGLRCI